MDSMKKIDTDLLGDKAENYLDIKCNDVGLRTIVPKPDIEGVDRKIVWVRPGKMVLAAGDSYDTIKPSRTANIQVKGTQNNEGVVKVKLSAAKQLVDISGPAFILIVRFDKEDKATLAFLHVTGDVTKRILKSLRKCHAKKRMPHKTDITFRMSKGDIIKESEIKTYLENQIGDDMGAYAKSKIGFREACGYEIGRYSMDIILKADNRASMIDGLMGRTSLEIVKAEHFETRFDITLPSKSPFDGNDLRINLSPMTVGDWIVNVKGNHTVTLTGSVATNFVPGMPTDIIETQWTSGLCKLVISDGKFDVSLDVDAILNQPHLPRIIIQNILFMQTIFDGATINIQTENGKTLFTLPPLEIINPTNTFRVEYWLSLAKSVEYIWEKAGMEEYPVTLSELEADDINSTSILLDPTCIYQAKSGHVKITRGFDEMDEAIKDANSIGYAISMMIGEKRVGICSIFEASVTTENDSFVLKTNKLSKSNVRLLRTNKEESDFELFFEDQRTIFTPSVWLKSFTKE